VRIIDIIFNYMMIYEAQIKARLKWVKLYVTTKDAGLVCCPCGKPHQPSGSGGGVSSRRREGLEDRSRGPHNSLERKVFELELSWIAGLRKRRLGSRQIQNN
jgi:hypothetical protein